MVRKIGLLTVTWIALIFSIALAEEFRYDKGARRDPFISFIGTDKSLEEGQARTGGIEGIVFDPKGGSYVVIGGEIYREGESVGDEKILRIAGDRVVFVQDNEETVIWLREEIVQESNGSEIKGSL